MPPILRHRLCCPVTDAGAAAILDEIIVAAPTVAETGVTLADVGALAATGTIAAGGAGAFGGAAGGGGPTGTTSSVGINDQPLGFSPGESFPTDSPGQQGILTPTTPDSVTPVSSDALANLGVGAPEPPPDLSFIAPDTTAAPADISTTVPSQLPGAPTGSDLQDFGKWYSSEAGGSAPTSGGGDFGSSLTKFFSNPKNDLTAGMLGMSLVNALSKPKLPSAANSLLSSSSDAARAAQQVINAGGAAGPGWVQQKAAIDASIAQQEQQLLQSIQQNAVNAGQGGVNSGLVQQQIAQARQQLETQRQTLYDQAMKENLNAAIAELTGGNQGLAAIANMQLAETQQARTQSQELARLAAQLNQLQFPGG